MMWCEVVASAIVREMVEQEQEQEQEQGDWRGRATKQLQKMAPLKRQTNLKHRVLVPFNVIFIASKRV